MKHLSYDGFTELKLADMCIDDSGRLVPRDDFETAQEVREAMREEQFRRRTVPMVMVAAAYGLLAALLILLVGGRLT